MTKHFLSSHTKLITDYYTSDFTTNITDISSEVRVMRQAALKNTLYHE